LTNQTRRRTNRTGGADSFPATKLSSSSLARLPYTCAIQRSVKLGLARHRLSIGSLIFAILSAIYGHRRFQRNRALAAKVPALVDQVLDRLSTQKEIAFESDGEEDPFLFLPNLRDDVLRSLHSLAERDRLWKRVRVVVEQNSNVRTAQRESHNGEVGRAWEWIGPVRPTIGDGSAASAGRITSGGRRKGGVPSRVSWGPGVKEESAGDENDRPRTAESKTGVHRRWEESRPIWLAPCPLPHVLGFSLMFLLLPISYLFEQARLSGGVIPWGWSG